MQSQAAESDIAARAERLQRWLFEHALPIWWDTGADPRGGFYEKIDQQGRPLDLPQRARTVARQVFSYAQAGRLGWTGPWREAVRHALDQLTTRFLTSEGAVVAVVEANGRIVDETLDLYNQAFALLAFASAHQAFPNEPGWRTRAVALRDLLRSRYAHPAGGYYEDAAGTAIPLRSNPHMHLLESALAWAAIDEDSGWRSMADDIVALCLDRFIDSQSGALREFFVLDWSPAPGLEGRIVEPGHQYEWAVLLDAWARLTGRPQPAAVRRLAAFADAHGVDRRRGVAVNALLLDGAPHEPTARLWPQTERLRACALNDSHADLDAAIEGLEAYLQTAVPGLWYDRLAAHGRFIEEPAPASSLYHIVGAVQALTRAAGRLA